MAGGRRQGSEGPGTGPSPRQKIGPLVARHLPTSKHGGGKSGEKQEARAGGPGVHVRRAGALLASCEGLARVAAHPSLLPLREEVGGCGRASAAAGGCWDGGGPCGGTGRTRGHVSGCADVRKIATRGKKAPVRTRRKRCEKGRRQGIARAVRGGGHCVWGETTHR